MKKEPVDRKEYKNLAEDSVASDEIMGYKKPGQGHLGVYAQGFIGYTDIDGDNQMISKEQMPEFLRALRMKDDPWLQNDFLQMFQQQPDLSRLQFQARRMHGLDVLLNDLPVPAQLDYHLIMIGARIAQLQIIHKGKNRDAAWCRESKNLYALYKTLTESLQQYEKSMKDLNKETLSRHSQTRYQEILTTLEDQWSSALELTRGKFTKDWDTRNIVLNVGAFFSGFGFLMLLAKNIQRKVKGQHFELFQFDQTHAKQARELENVSRQSQASISHFKKRPEQHPSPQMQRYFTHELKATEQSIAALGEQCMVLRRQIDFRGKDTSKNKLRSSQMNFLNHLHEDLTDVLQTCQKRIAVLLTKNWEPNSEKFQKEIVHVERDLMEKWCQVIKTIPTDHKGTLSFGLELSNSVLGLYPVREQFLQELDTDSKGTTQRLQQ